MSKITMKFDTVCGKNPVNGRGGWLPRLQDVEIFDEENVFEEVAKEMSLPLNKELVQFVFLAVLKTMARKVSEDGRARKIGKYLKFTPTLRGRLPGRDSPFDPAQCEAAVTVTALSGLTKKMDLEKVEFVNVNEDAKPVVEHVSSIGVDEPDILEKGRPFAAYGRNLQFDADIGDAAELRWKDPGGEERSVGLAPFESDYSHAWFEWKPELDAIPDGAEATLYMTTRCGRADGAPRLSKRRVSMRAIEQMSD